MGKVMDFVFALKDAYTKIQATQTFEIVINIQLLIDVWLYTLTK